MILFRMSGLLSEVSFCPTFAEYVTWYTESHKICNTHYEIAFQDSTSYLGPIITKIKSHSGPTSNMNSKIYQDFILSSKNKPYCYLQTFISHILSPRSNCKQSLFNAGIFKNHIKFRTRSDTKHGISSTNPTHPPDAVMSIVRTKQKERIEHNTWLADPNSNNLRIGGRHVAQAISPTKAKYHP